MEKETVIVPPKSVKGEFPHPVIEVTEEQMASLYKGFALNKIAKLLGFDDAEHLDRELNPSRRSRD